MEHVTTREGVEFVSTAGANVAGTLTVRKPRPASAAVGIPGGRRVRESAAPSNSPLPTAFAAVSALLRVQVQHLLLNRNDLLVGGLKPHNYCLPILKARMPGPPTGFDLNSDRCWRRMACRRPHSPQRHGVTSLCCPSLCRPRSIGGRSLRLQPAAARAGSAARTARRTFGRRRRRPRAVLAASPPTPARSSTRRSSRWLVRAMRATVGSSRPPHRGAV